MGKLLCKQTYSSCRMPTRLTLLHSNDIHADFLAESSNGTLVGGVSRLSGYVNQVRQQEPHVLYAIAGDLFQGSVIDSESKGISTIEICNLLGPDVVTIGNHEVDYGLGHLLLLEKCAWFPMINANFHVKQTGTRLFPSHTVLQCGGLRILFIGLTNEAILSMARKDPLTGPLVDISDPLEEVERICNNYSHAEIGLTVLLTHMGFEEDQHLAARLDPAWGVDLIIGGHSHTLPEEPACVNGVLIVQAGSGTDQIGRLDLEVDPASGTVLSHRWQAVPITEDMPGDPELEALVERFRTQAAGKYDRVLTRFSAVLPNPARNRETALGNLFADLLADALGLDVMLLAAGSLRCPSLGPTVTYGALKEAMPFDDDCSRIPVRGSTLKKMLRFMLREETFTGFHTEFYHISRRLRLRWSRSKGQFEALEYDGLPLEDNRLLHIGLQRYHLTNFEGCFGLPFSEAQAGPAQVVSTSCFQVLEEQLQCRPHLTAAKDGRITVTE